MNATQNQTRTGRICNQNMARECSISVTVSVSPFRMSMFFYSWPYAGFSNSRGPGAKVGNRIGNVLQFLPALFLSRPARGCQNHRPLDLHFEDIARLHDTGGLRAAPTPPGVPVMITSPRSRLHCDADHFNFSSATPKISWFCARILHHAAISNGPGCAIRVLPAARHRGVTSHGPERSGAIEILTHRPPSICGGCA